jgi:hypothetical protein
MALAVLQGRGGELAACLTSRTGTRLDGSVEAVGELHLSHHYHWLNERKERAT